ncbi:Glycosyl hydrolase 53-domain-containing protein [Mycena sanguinolenta]|uniref:Glycosyl hydrolase 53-domain-containing protein n=1 Tax=Mycena sanguinolenta TaxID=230812 RepID=A0A8H6Y2I3_9AGAR|nr:Glycosyl hydrolase 53-domain-containing protein [Mycena sanguinolenta]
MVPLSSSLTFILAAWPLLASGTKLPKRGLAFALPKNPTATDIDNAAVDITKANQSTGAVSWVYNWNITAPDYLADSGLEFVPMQWNGVGIENLAATVKQLGAKYVLAFNEPDSSLQANMTPETAASLWMQYFEPLKTEDSTIQLGAPAVTSNGTGIPWLQKFMTECATCTIDFIPFHWYGMGSASFYQYLYEFNSLFPSYPLWITEYADTTLTDEAMTAFMDTTLTGESTHPLDDIDFVERYAWFAYERTQTDGFHYYLMDAQGDLTTAGQKYVLGLDAPPSAVRKRVDVPTNYDLWVFASDEPRLIYISLKFFEFTDHDY